MTDIFTGVTKAVILARGLGTRMRAADPNAPSMAETDLDMKALIRVGRPFLDYVLSALADAGFTDACLVVGPEHTAIREYYAAVAPRRIAIAFAIQEHALGTANALLSAEPFAGGEAFLVLNSDNYYPCEVLAALQKLGEPGLAAFDRESLVRDSNIPRERVRSYAVLDVDADGYLARIVEKPSEEQAIADDAYVSMNCWRLDSSIFQACREIPRSSRGEFELPDAVQHGIDALGLRFKAIAIHAGVLDLSYRGDIAEVARRLADVRVTL